MNSVYYRIYFYKDRFQLVAMQDFDETDYYQDHFLNDKRYSSEEEAKKELYRLAAIFHLPIKID